MSPGCGISYTKLVPGTCSKQHRLQAKQQELDEISGVKAKKSLNAVTIGRGIRRPITPLSRLTISLTKQIAGFRQKSKERTPRLSVMRIGKKFASYKAVDFITSLVACYHRLNIARMMSASELTFAEAYSTLSQTSRTFRNGFHAFYNFAIDLFEDADSPLAQKRPAKMVE
ncbi:hypothetical protein GALMADRAFT_134099 [Galerina marginata CBS 339.88]|uniref:Uncharacterized protein n=1 Tax=Galerina marginata (strain CBS 339.88) TaxID=685588 RepID=A0A067THA0_GALM3|nr:hypothetical protein GALMADRAFT_134099 [Galerina marginata CBS 339.88]